MLKVVEDTESWGIYGPGIDEPRLFVTPEQAFGHFVMHPEDWPEDVDFWMELCRWGREWNALGYSDPELKRPRWRPVPIIRFMRKASLGGFDVPATACDFWFVAQMMQTLVRCGYRYVHVPVEGEAQDAHICSGSFHHMVLPVRRRADWATNFLPVTDFDTLRFMRLECISKPIPKSRHREIVRYRSWA